MNLRTKIFVFVLVAITFTALTLFIGCAAQKPSDSIVKELIRENLRDGVPTSWIESSSTVFSTSNVKLKSIKIEEWGNFNESLKYWPAKIRIVGSAKALESRNSFTSPFADVIREFDKLAEFRFYQDDYGKWKVSRQ